MWYEQRSNQFTVMIQDNQFLQYFKLLIWLDELDMKLVKMGFELKISWFVFQQP